MKIERRVSRLEGSARNDEHGSTVWDEQAEEQAAADVRAMIEAPRPEFVPLEDRSAEDLKRELEKCDRNEGFAPAGDEIYVRVMDWWRACVMGEFFRRQDVKMTPQQEVAFIEGVRKSRGGCSTEALLEELDRKVAAARLEAPIPGRPN